MSLSPQRLRVVLELLERHEATLAKLSEEQEADRRRRIGRAYRIILEYKVHRVAREEKDAGDED